MIVRLEGDGTLAQRLYRGLRGAILDGRIAPRSRLPSTRSLAKELGLSRNVVLAAFDELIGEGYVSARVGSGTYVSGSMPDVVAPRPPASGPAPSPAPVVRLSAQAQRALSLRSFPVPGTSPQGRWLPWDFRYGQSAPEDFPHALWSRLVARRARSLSVRTLWYGRTRGYMPLREAIVSHLRRARGVVASVDRVIIVSGTQQALDLVARLLVDRGERVVIEEPSYLAARQVFLAAGAKLVPVTVDGQGLDVSCLPKSGSVRLAFLTPSHQFPLGSVMPLDRRLELLRWAEASGAHVIEDDYDAEFRYDGSPLPAMQGMDHGGRVIYIGSFSKVMFPSLRIGYLVVPPALVPGVVALKFLSDVHSPTFEQEVLAEFMAEGHFERHLRRAAARNASRRAALLAAFAEHFGDRVEIVGARAGVHVVAWLNDVRPRDLPALVERAALGGVGIYPVTPYFLRPPGRAGLLVGYTSLKESEIRGGVRALAGVMGRATAPPPADAERVPSRAVPRPG